MSSLVEDIATALSDLVESCDKELSEFPVYRGIRGFRVVNDEDLGGPVAYVLWELAEPEKDGWDPVALDRLCSIAGDALAGMVETTFCRFRTAEELEAEQELDAVSPVASA